MVGIHKVNILRIAVMLSFVVLASIVVSFISLASVQAATQGSGYNYGDANRSGAITSMDRTWLNQMIMGTRAFDSVADCNMDGRKTTMDRTWLNQIIMGTRVQVDMMVAAYDFSIGAGTARWAKSNSLSDLPPVLSDTFDTDPAGWVEATSEQYINISEEHTDVWTIVADSYATLQCKFTIDEGPDAGDITSIRVYFNGSSESSGDVLKFWMWNFAGAEWTQIGPGVTLSTSNESHNSGWTAWGTIFANYIDANGYIYVSVIDTNSGDDLNVNYVRLDIVTPTPFEVPQPTSTATVEPTEIPNPTPTPTTDLPTPTPTETVVIIPTPTPTPTSVPCEHAYDFINVTRSSGPHDAYYLSVYNMPPPHWRWHLFKTEATDGEYAAISASDDLRWQTPNPGGSHHVLAAFEMVIDEEPASVNRIVLVFEGYGEIDNAFEIWAYNFVTAKGERIGSKMDIPTGSDSTMIRSITSHCSDYIGDGGKVIWGVYEKKTTHYTDGYWMAIDYVKLVATCMGQ